MQSKMCPLALPSFPTRRSSDLHPHQHPVTDQGLGLGGDHQPLGVVGAVGAHRSEEHTSELQSRGQLVCRLLLEKKKNIIKKLNEKDAEEIMKTEKRTTTRVILK